MFADTLKNIFCFGIICVLLNKYRFVDATKSTEINELGFISIYDEFTYGYGPVNFSLADVTDDDVTFHLYSKAYPEGIYLETDDTNTNVSTEIPTKFIIHGWFENETADWVNAIKREYLHKGDYNVILVDWKKPASKIYDVSAANTKPVGSVIADRIINLELNLTKVHLIGFSLGSHVSGFAGKKIFNETGSKIERITGNDPAREQFEHEKIGSDSRLSRDDATFVDVIHTDTGHYGFVNPIGSVDFYVNGGRSQPGCPPLILDRNCSHVRSNYYFAESINSYAFVALQCTFSGNPFENNVSPFFPAIFGENVHELTTGTYCLGTNYRSPFALAPTHPSWELIF